MIQKSNLPKTESELRDILDRYFLETKQALEKGDHPSFKGLLEVIQSDANILTSIHNIKGNKGSRTPGTDGKTIEDYILQRGYEEVIKEIKDKLFHYKPQPVRRKWIDKEGKKEKRPLGIPTIIDRVIQECVRNIIEPILEAQFFNHSYGFRPMRESQMAIARINNLLHHGYQWVVEGDISKFFDTVNHRILLKKLWHMGIRDRRVLMIIKAMLQAGIMGEVRKNDLGTPQGGIISPLLANVYLHSFDEWVTREWEEKQTRHQYHPTSRLRALKKNSNLKPAYLVRYADDWVLITNSKQNAIKWKQKIEKYLKENLKIELSAEKTLITKASNSPINFLGYEIKLIEGKSVSGYVVRSRPNKKRIKTKVNKLRKKIRELRRTKTKEFLIHRINETNSIIRGLIEYYKYSSMVNKDFHKFSHQLDRLAFNSLKGYGAKWLPANEAYNLKSVHNNYSTTIPTIQYQDLEIAVTSLGFVKWTKPTFKNQDETPYSAKGRELYKKRTGKKKLIARADETLKIHLSQMIGKGLVPSKYNFEYFLNRAYAFNRDKGKCRVCSGELNEHTVHTHHIFPKLPLTKLNKVPNLASVHKICHERIHSKKDLSNLYDKKSWEKLKKFRDKLSSK